MDLAADTVAACTAAEKDAEATTAAIFRSGFSDVTVFGTNGRTFFPWEERTWVTTGWVGMAVGVAVEVTVSVATTAAAGVGVTGGISLFNICLPDAQPNTQVIANPESMIIAAFFSMVPPFWKLPN
jgi:hypothetical protein